LEKKRPLKVAHLAFLEVIYFSDLFGSFLGAVLIHSYGNEISFNCKLNSFSYEWLLCTKTRFEKEAKDNSEMAYHM